MPRRQDGGSGAAGSAAAGAWAREGREGKPLRFTEEEFKDLLDSEYGDPRTFILLALLFPHMDTKNRFHVLVTLEDAMRVRRFFAMLSAALAMLGGAVFTQLKPTTRSITLRLPETLLAGLKTAANQRDVPYQSLIKVWLQEKVDQR